MNKFLMEIHKKAEETLLAKRLIAGELSLEQWNYFLCNQYFIYNFIEKQGIIEVNSIKRCDKIIDDIGKFPNLIHPIVLDYIVYLSKLDKKDLWAHIYVKYLGDLYGGKMISDACKWKSSCLQFEDREASIFYIRQHTIDCSTEELVKAFEWVINIYSELIKEIDNI